MNSPIATTAPAQPAPSRVLTLTGGCNFRDIGGYATATGRTVKWGRVYRAGVLSYFTDEDHAVLGRLKVRAICDLRRAEERTREPTRWLDEATQALSWEDGDNTPTIRAFAARCPNTAAGMHEAMLALYRALPAWMAPRIRGLFDCVADQQTPVVVHCAAGKDRTGVAIAVLLGALGVPRETILEDYLLTNSTGDFENFIRTRHDIRLGLAEAHQPLLTMSAEVRKVLFSANAAFLDAALTQIDSDHGSLEAYLTEALLMNPGRLQQVRELLLE